MKQIQYTEYGSPYVLKVIDADKPKVGDNEVLIKTIYSGVSSADSRIRKVDFPKGFGFISRLMFGFNKPKNNILGGSFSGVVDEVGDSVAGFKAGDRVCGMTGMKMGCYSEYIKVKEKGNTVKIPKGVTDKDACAALFGGTTAINFLEDVAKLKVGEKVLINGASGSVGSSMIQLANVLGSNVSGICSNKNAKLVKSIGASEVIDYKNDDFTSNNQKYDMIVDTIGNLSFKSVKNSLSDKGRFVSIIGSLGEGLSSIFIKKSVGGVSPENRDIIGRVLNYISQDNIKPVISKIYSYKEVVKAHELIDSKRKVGNILLEW